MELGNGRSLRFSQIFMKNERIVLGLLFSHTFFFQIKPREISKDSFWAQTAEEKFANERLFETLKKKFAAK